MDSSVVQFFERGRVLITGSTGFMGKILVEKLLRVCPGIEEMNLLIRVKKGKEPNARLKELFDDPVFSLLKSDYPHVLSKVRVIPGDCSQPGLGISENDRQNLTHTLTHVFHGAAIVRFDEKLRTAISINVVGVREMIKFCRYCTQLKSILHTSTAYANCPLMNLQEQFYKAPLTGESAIQLLDCLEEEKMESITPELIKPWPNTYSFTKAIAEEVIQKHGEGLPIAVFRPSIVIGTAKEPIKGWIDNLYGPTGVVVGVGAGLMRVLYADGDILADLVPVDMAVNALICAAWDIGQQHLTRTANQPKLQDDRTINENTDKSKNIPIYHFVVSRKNSLTWGEYLHYNMKHGREIPSIKAIWYYTLTITNVWALYKLLTVLYHLIPALIMDAGLLLSGNKAQMWRAYQKIHKFSGVISNFSTKEWVFGEENTLGLWEKLSPIDKTIFEFDMRTLDWNQYFKDSVDGVRIFLFQDKPSTLPSARRKMFLFHIAHRLLQLVLLSLLIWASYSVFGSLLSSQPEIFPSLTSSRWASRKVLLTT